MTLCLRVGCDKYYHTHLQRGFDMNATHGLVPRIRIQVLLEEKECKNLAIKQL